MDTYKYEQAKRRATKQANKYLRDNGYKTASINCTRGVFHLTNGHQYFLSAAGVLAEATGLNFIPLNSFMAKLDKAQF